MDNYHLRTTILKLLDRLSDHDRQRLHFLLANDVPRPIRDNASTSGTLYLMESLFDQDKLSEENFTILIDAFKGIKCIEGLKILKEHKKRVHINLSNQRTSKCSNPPLIDQIFQDQEEEEEDKSPSHSLLDPIKTYVGYTKIIKNNSNTNTNTVTINLDTKSSSSVEEHPFYISFKMNKYLFSAIGLLLLLVIGIAMTILIVKLNTTDYTSREKILLEEQKQFKKKIQNLENQLSEQNNLPVKAGQIYGFTDSDAAYFDDSSSSDFTCSHYLNGIFVRCDDQGFETYQFSYYSPHAKYQEIQSSFHGDEQFPQRTEFDFLHEKIDKVEGQIVNKIILSENGTEFIKPVITGIKFTTKENHANHLFNESSGMNFNESFPGYTLGYVTGRSNQYIEQIQFFWYRI